MAEVEEDFEPTEVVELGGDGRVAAADGAAGVELAAGVDRVVAAGRAAGGWAHADSSSAGISESHLVMENPPRRSAGAAGANRSDGSMTDEG
jgi:hypothetical protein